MSTRTREETVCDIKDDEPAEEHGEARTIRFGIGGREWEAEFCAGHELAITMDLEPFIAAARPARSKAKARVRPATARRHSAAMRAWAKQQGLTDKDRGRVAASVVAKYEAARRGQR